MKKTLYAILIVALLPMCAMADYFSGDDIVDLYDNKFPESNAIMRGYFAGIQDAFNGTAFCVPPEVKMDQAAGIIIKYVRDFPDLRYKTGKNLVTEALQQAFPCGPETDDQKAL